MATPTTIYITPRQRQALFRRARRRGTTFSEELRAAVDLYLDFGEDFEPAAFAELATQAGAAARRGIGRLEQAISSLRAVSRKLSAMDRRLDELDQRRV